MGTLESERKTKAQKRLKQLADVLSENGLSNRELVRKMFPDLDPNERKFQNAYTIFNKKKNGKGKHVVSADYAMLVCKAASEEGVAVRWKWLAGYE